MSRRVATAEPMANTYTSLNYHLVFSTKNREPLLIASVCERLWPYLGGIARENGMKALEICGVADHVHTLISLPATLSVAKALQFLKGNSSKWIHETFPKMASFGWQEGYSAFKVCESQVDRVRRYIQNQREHHAKVSFRDELIALFEAYGVKYDPDRI